MGKFGRLLVLCLVPFPATAPAGESLVRVEYPGFTLWLDCTERAAVVFHYRAAADTGSLPRRATFSRDPDIADECQQYRTTSYRGGNEPYDRGHLVPANHLDHLAEGIRLSNRMVNVLPQVAAMNRGAWLATEALVECYRDIEPLEVWGGVLFGFDESNDHFTASHGVRTPDWFWKVVIAADNPRRHVAWILPNRAEARASRLDDYLVPIGDIEFFTGLVLPADETTKDDWPLASWPLPGDCDPG